MADTFLFGAENDDDIVLSDEECLDSEEEYDALNDETFGTLEDATGLDDWEEQHEHFAEIEENNKQTSLIESSLTDLVLKESNLYPASTDSVWAYKETNKNGTHISASILHNIQSPALTQSKDKSFHGSAFSDNSKAADKVLTLEEIERNLLKDRHKVPLTNSNVPHPQQLLTQIPAAYPLNRYPPGFPPPPPPPLNVPVPHPHIRHMPHGPPGMSRLIPPSHYMHPAGHQHGPTPPPPPPGFFPPNPPFPMNRPSMYFPLQLRVPPLQPRMPPNMMPHPNMHNMVPHQNQQNHNEQHRRNYNNNLHYREPYDEYAGLMSNREKQWLINIQLVQLNTGTPYFDDYYFTISKERKSKNVRETQYGNSERGRRQNNRRNSEREGQNSLTPKVYTPLQFENSLGKLQCGSVTAPRKIIDTDIVTPDKDGEVTSNSSRDSKKTKQLLLELETLYNYILKAEDLNNVMYKQNLEKLFEIKQKQKLRELDLATTPEQKQEILKSLREDSEPFDEDPHDYLTKVMNGFFQEEKYISFLNIRKGKMLLLRLLPYLSSDRFSAQLCDIWIKVFLSIPTVGRKDANGDNLFVRLYPFFKRFIQISDMDVVLELLTNLLEVLTPNVSRGTPVIGKQLLNFVVGNKFGVSALVAIFMRVEQFIAVNNIDEEQKTTWLNFLRSLAESLSVPKVVLESPIEKIPTDILKKHTSLRDFSEESISLLEKWLTNNCS